jgi:tetratricopeptide (TPR) repeat protein
MLTRSLHPITLSVVLTTWVAASPRARAQDALQTVKDLYASAAYEDALAAVGRLGSLAPSIETAQYRVFCLVALGRMVEADRAVESLLTAEPEYHPDPAQASPRILALFSQVRHRIGPGLVKQAYHRGRAAMDHQDREEAIGEFEAMLRLADDPDVRDDAMVTELRDLGSGFLTLSRALPSPARPAAANSPTVPSPGASRTSVITPPAIIQQKLPPWVANPLNKRATEFHGAIRVQISAEGKVVSAEMVRSIHPAYDAVLLLAARGWLYEPARKDGAPIAIEKTVDIVVSPAPGK